MIYQVRHRTVIRYTALARLARFNLRLQPYDWPGQRIEDYRLDVQPAPASIEARPATYPVQVARLVIDAPLTQLSIETSFRATVDAPAIVPQPGDPSIADVARAALVARDVGPSAPANFLYASPRAPLAPQIGAWAADILHPDRGILDAALALSRHIRSSFSYDPSATDAGTPVEDAFAARHGVCQDFAHIMVVALRMAGLSACYVSGYLRTDPPPGRPRLIGADAMHAWVMLWCGPDRGWIGFDPTNGVITGEGHLFVAMGRDYADVAPMDGIFVGNAAQSVQVMVDVMPVDESSPQPV